MGRGDVKKQRRPRVHTLENRLYCVGLVFLCILAALTVVFYVSHEEIMEADTCVLRKITGYYCPGCGGTRAFMSFIKGDIIMSFYYHPVVPYALILYMVFMVTHTLERIMYVVSVYAVKKQSEAICIRGIRFHNWYLYMAVIIIVVNVTVRNIIIAFF